MVKLVIKGKVIEFIKVLHLSPEGYSFVIYGEPEDFFEKDHILFFGEKDLDELIIHSQKQSQK